MPGRRQFQWHWPALLATLLVAATGLKLCLWQLTRAEQKQAIFDAIASRADASPVSLAALSARDDPAHYPVLAQGYFDNEHSILLDNRILDGIAGYHLISPFHTDEGQWVLVNRGWLPRGRERDQLPAITALEGHFEVVGTSYLYSSQTFTLADDDLKHPEWPLRLQKIEMHAIGEALGVELAPFEIRVSPGAALEPDNQLPRPWQDAQEQLMGPERHRAYALQWFALAVLAIVVFVAASFRKTDDTSSDTP